jgi:RNA polymerase sigma-70 factor (ECF subfamily)
MRATPHLALVPEPGAVGAKVWYRQVVAKEAVTLSRAALDHLDVLYRVARNLTGRDSDAEDLVQETYTRAIAAAGQFTTGTNLRAWLLRILRNAHIDDYRRTRRNPVDGGFDDDLAACPRATAPEPLRGDAELERLRGVVTADIEAALASLSVDARALILLDLEGLTETELAESFECAVGTVKSRLSRARALLRERLRDYGS